MIDPIEEIWKREFGFVLQHNGKTFMRRKLSFETQRELEAYIEEKKPLDCYVSVAFYQYPTQMRDWLGSELFFDFDSKENVKLAYADAITAYEVLKENFALNNISLRFSGAKGYHVIVNDPIVRTLRQRERRQIADYLCFRYRLTTLDAAAACDISRLRRIAGTKNSKSGKFCSILL